MIQVWRRRVETTHNTSLAPAHLNKHFIIHHQAMTDESCWRILENVSNLIYMLMVCWEWSASVSDFLILHLLPPGPAERVRAKETSYCTWTICDLTTLFFNLYIFLGVCGGVRNSGESCSDRARKGGCWDKLGTQPDGSRHGLLF